MPATTGPRNSIDYAWVLGETPWNVGMDSNLRRLDRVLAHLSVKDRDLSAPPGAPANGDTYIVGPAPTGAWAGQATKIAYWSTEGTPAWAFYTPRTGWIAYVEDEAAQCKFTGGAWGSIGGNAGPFDDATAIIKGSADPTKLLRIEVDGLTTATTRVMSVPDADFTPGGLGLAQSWTAQNTFAAGVITTSQPHACSQTWNDGAVTFKARTLAITSTASAAASLADEVKVDAATIYSLRKDGRALWQASTGNGIGLDAASSSGISYLQRSGSVGGNIRVMASSLSAWDSLSALGVYLAGTGKLSFSSTSNPESTSVALAYNSAGVLEVNNGTVTQYRDLIARTYFADTYDSRAGVNLSIKTNNVQALLFSGGYMDCYSHVQGQAGTQTLGQFRRVVTALVGNGTLSDGYNLRVMTNEGVTAKSEITLMTAAAGGNVEYVCQDSDGIKLIAAAGDTIRVIDKVTAAAGYIESTTIGSVVRLVAINATEWVAMNIRGVWTDGTFTYDDTALTAP